jgi:O-antigen ligase
MPALAAALVVLLALAAVSLLPAGGGNLFERLMNPSNAAMDEYRTAILWPRIWAHLLDRGWLATAFGEGLNSCGIFVSRTDPFVRDAHNVYLDWLFDWGIVGIAVVSWFFYAVRRQILASAHPYTNILYGWYVYLLVSGMTVTESGDKGFWILLGVGVGCYGLEKRPPRPVRGAASARLPALARPLAAGRVTVP